MKLCLLAVLVLGQALLAAPGKDMARVEGGSFTPFYLLNPAFVGPLPSLVPGGPPGPPTVNLVHVDTFLLDRYPVTNRQYLEFVRSHPEWRRSRVRRVFAEERYLQDWRGDLEVDAALLDSPVTWVSWFAARAYCKSQGKRLPTQLEWEYAARASESSRDGLREPAFRQRILDWYARPSPARYPRVGSVFRNVYGIWDMHGLVWEWVDDFNSVLLTGESRGDSGLDRNLFCAAGVTSSTDPSDYAAYMRYAFRFSLQARYTVANLGFRGAR